MKKLIFLCLLVSGVAWADDSEVSLDERIAKFRQENKEALAKATDPVEMQKGFDEAWAAHHARFSKPNAKIGMTEDQVIKNTFWGEPSDKNYTTTKYGTREQWVYKNLGYLYFENGKVVAIQSF